MYCTLWEECNQPQCPHRSWRERTAALMWYYSPTIKTRANTYDFWLSSHYMENTIAIYSYSTPWALFPQKLCFAPEFFVLISSHCSTQIWRMRNGGSWCIYFLNYIISYFTIQPKRQLWGGGDHTRKLRGRDITVSLSVKVKPLSVFVSSL